MKPSPSADPRVKRPTRDIRTLLLTYVSMLLIAALQMGIIWIMQLLNMPEYLRTPLILIYWIVIAAAFVWMTNNQIQNKVEQPLRELGEAANKVASGDFSVYLTPRHLDDQADYLDVMFADFNKMVAELGSIETLKNDFIANVSHEIKTPLAVICNYAAVLQSKTLREEEIDEILQAMVDAANRLSSMVTNMLKINKLDSQKIVTNAVPFDLCDQLADCALTFMPIWEEKRIEFEVDMEEQAIFVGDQETMRLVWNNLLSNAIKFTPNGGRISLHQHSEAEHIVVTVSDTGCGMNEETLKHVFDKFYQGDTSHSGEGNGLGLALAHRIVEISGGTISVVSRIGAGSSFTVRLPIVSGGNS